METVPGRALLPWHLFRTLSAVRAACRTEDDEASLRCFLRAVGAMPEDSEQVDILAGGPDPIARWQRLRAAGKAPVTEAARTKRRPIIDRSTTRRIITGGYQSPDLRH